MEPRISLITLGVTDLSRARAFYRRLGWRESSAGNEQVAFFQIGGAILALFPRQALAEDAGLPAEGTGFAGIALAHNVRTREEVASVLEEARVAGGRILKPARDTDWGGRSGYFADPDGHLWEVAWNPHFPLDPDGGIRLPER